MREEKTKYYVIKEKAVPEVLLKVIEAKRLMDMQELTVQQATEKAGISRSSFYKYKDDILPFHDNAKGKTITFILQMDDEPGLLSDVLKIIAEFHGNILTIHQTIPLNGVASLTISVDIAEDRGAFTFIYSKRTGTRAATMENQVPDDVVKDRFDRLLKEVQTISSEKAKCYEGKVVPVLAEEMDDQKDGYVTGRMDNNSIVHFPGTEDMIGNIYNVKLDECRGFYYMGEIKEDA